MTTRRQAGRLAALVIGVALGLCAAEGLVRAVWLLRHGTVSDRDGYSGRFLEHHERFGWLGIPLASVRHRTTEFDVAIEIDRQGLRRRRRPLTPATRRVCLLGDSFAFGQGVHEFERVGAELEAARSGLRVETLALPGLGTDQELLLYREHDGPYVACEVVVLLYFIESLERNVARERHGLAKPWFELQEGALHLRGVPVPPRLDAESAPTQSPGARAWLRRHSSLYSLLRWRTIDRIRDASRDPVDPHPDYAANGPAWQLTSALLAELRDTTAERGVELALAIVPERWHLAEGSSRAHQRAVLETCARLEIPALDLTTAFVESGPARGRDAYYPTDGHWNARGHGIAAHALADFLEARGLLD